MREEDEACEGGRAGKRLRVRERMRCMEGGERGAGGDAEERGKQGNGSKE